MRSLILSPTRELALQSATAAERLTSGTGLVSGVVFGGTSTSVDDRLFSHQVDLLIATPGRMLDNLRRNTGGITKRLQGLRHFVLDEADRMLDMGFRPDVESILEFLPRSRQSLLFSATVPRELLTVAKSVLGASSFFVIDASSNCSIREVSSTKELEESIDDPLSTASTIPQTMVKCALRDTVSVTFDLLLYELKLNPRDAKVVVFLPTARLAQLYANVFQVLSKGDLYGVPILEIHSRKSQSARLKASETFTKSNGPIIMFSSDVTARGMDYPNVTYVLQVGRPPDFDQCVHRLGRTARAGKSGRASIVLVQGLEEQFQSEIRMLPVKDETRSYGVPLNTSTAAVQRAMQQVHGDVKESSYVAWLGYYNSVKKGGQLTKPDLIQTANAFAIDVLLCRELPFLEAKTVGKMGLKGVPGLRIAGRGQH